MYYGGKDSEHVHCSKRESKLYPNGGPKENLKVLKDHSFERKKIIYIILH